MLIECYIDKTIELNKMKILNTPQDKFQELSNNLVVICQYNRKDNNEVVYGIDLQYKDQYPTFEEVEVLTSEETFWHEPEKTIQVKQSNEDCLAMLDEYPEVGVFRKQNSIITYRENGFVYVYVNTLFPEHRALFEQFNAEINEK